MKRALALSLLVGLTACTSSEPADFHAYAAELRHSGMTEMAASDLQMAASLLLGTRVAVMNQDPATKEWSRGLMSTTCAAPAARRDGDSRELDALVRRLRSIADTDSSGFVSTAEASQLRTSVECAYYIQSLVGQHVTSVPDWMAALSIDKAGLEQECASYARLRPQLVALGTHPPDAAGCATAPGLPRTEPG